MGGSWISPRDQLPAEGAPVEIRTLAGSSDVGFAKRLGDGWWVERRYGGPYLMGDPAVPALWRQAAQKQSSQMKGTR